jgi:hypothetical protein
MYVGSAMKHMGGRRYQLWDEQDGFFYDVLRYPYGHFEKFRVRSLVGLIPLYAVERLEDRWIQPFAEFRSNVAWFLANKSEVVSKACSRLERDGEQVLLLAVVERDQMRRLLTRVMDPGSSCRPTGCAACRASTPGTPSSSAAAA